MKSNDQKVSRIDDSRISTYTNRQRSGSTQVFMTGTDDRDWDRYRADQKNGVQPLVMHQRADTIEIQPPERHFYAELIDGEWWWINGCAECNGRERDWMTYVECEKHNVCRTCSIPRDKLTETPWGGKQGWQCKPCAAAEHAAKRIEALQKFAEAEYDDYDFHHCDQVTCPHCATKYTPDHDVTDGVERCYTCGGEFQLEIEYSRSFSTTVVGKRVTTETPVGVES